MSPFLRRLIHPRRGRFVLLAIIGLAAISVMCLTTLAIIRPEQTSSLPLLIGFIGPVIAAFVGLWYRLGGVQRKLRHQDDLLKATLHARRKNDVTPHPPDNEP